MDALKDLKKYIDLYDTETVVMLLKSKFSYVSSTLSGKTFAKQGSDCKPSKNIPDKKFSFKIVDLILHRNGNATIKTDSNNLITFLNL